MENTDVFEIGTQEIWVPIFFQKIFSNFKPENTQAERSFFPEEAMLPSVFGNICFTAGIENSSITWGYIEDDRLRE